MLGICWTVSARPCRRNPRRVNRIGPKTEAPIKHIEFVSLSPDRALVVLVFANGHVENRIFTPPIGQTPSSLREAANFLNSIMQGHTLSEARQVVDAEIKSRRQELDTLAQELVETGGALWENEGERHERLIVRGVESFGKRSRRGRAFPYKRAV